jgi:hypothetical protein
MINATLLILKGNMRSRNKGSGSDLGQQLAEFVKQSNMKGKGPLSLALVLTRQASHRKMPLDPKDFLTKQGGQVAGMGKSAVQAMLKEYGIDRVLAEEAGRTSRGSIARMQAYVAFLNKLNEQEQLDLPRIEQWWISRVKEYFASKPFKLKLDPSKSLRHAVGELLDSAFARQKEVPGMMVAGAVMQHLVGAKLEIMSMDLAIEHWGFSVADSPGGRKGDFLIHDAAIHVTTAPTEALIRKCQENLEQGLRPIIITSESGIGGANALARNAGLADRIDILEVEQFVATNVYEKSAFAESNRNVTVNELVEQYNKIIDGCESDPSLKIVMGN